MLSKKQPKHLQSQLILRRYVLPIIAINAVIRGNAAAHGKQQSTFATPKETTKTLPPVTVPETLVSKVTVVEKITEKVTEKVTQTQKVTERVTDVEKITKTAAPVTIEKNNTLKFTETSNIIKPTTIESIGTKEIDKITTAVVVVTKVVPTG